MPRFSGETSISSSGRRISISDDGPTGYEQLTDGDALRVDEIVERVFHQLREMVRQMLMADVVQVVVVRILSHSPIEVSPRQDVLVNGYTVARFRRGF